MKSRTNCLLLHQGQLLGLVVVLDPLLVLSVSLNFGDLLFETDLVVQLEVDRGRGAARANIRLNQRDLCEGARIQELVELDWLVRAILLAAVPAGRLEPHVGDVWQVLVVVLEVAHGRHLHPTRRQHLPQRNALVFRHLRDHIPVILIQPRRVHQLIRGELNSRVWVFLERLELVEELVDGSVVKVIWSQNLKALPVEVLIQLHRFAANALRYRLHVNRSELAIEVVELQAGKLLVDLEVDDLLLRLALLEVVLHVLFEHGLPLPHRVLNHRGLEPEVHFALRHADSGRYEHRRRSAWLRVPSHDCKDIWNVVVWSNRL